MLPSIYVCLNYPLNIEPIASNIYSVFFRKDTCKKGNNRCDWTLTSLIKLFAAIVPIIIAYFVSNLVEVLVYSGLPGFILGFVFPAVLQLQSTRVCKKVFSVLLTEKTTSSMKDMDSHTSAEVVCSLQDKKPKKESSLYMTPYSTRILSHPVAVTILGSLGVIFFLVTIASTILSFIPGSEQEREDNYCN